MPVTHDDAANTLDSVTGINGVQHGGTGADLSATGPGFLKQASLGAAVTVVDDLGSTSATTAAAGTNSTHVATTAFVHTASLVIDPTVSPYSAVGDGSTDDTTAIQAALDAIRTSGVKGELRLPNKTFVVQTLTVGSNTTISGRGTLKRKTGYAGAILRNYDTSSTGNANITIRDIKLDGARTSATHDSTSKLIYFTYVTDSRIEGVTATGSQESGIVLEYCRDVVVARNVVKDCARNGIYLSGSDRVCIAGNVSRAHVGSASCGIALAASWFCTLTGNTVSGSSTQNAQGDIVLARDSRHNTLTGNVARTLVLVSEAVGGVTLPYHADHPGAPAAYGSEVWSGSYNVISANTFIGAPGAAISLTRGTGNMVTDNTIGFAVTYGVNVNGSSRAMVKGNTIFNVGTGGTAGTQYAIITQDIDATYTANNAIIDNNIVYDDQTVETTRGIRVAGSSTGIKVRNNTVSVTNTPMSIEPTTAIRSGNVYGTVTNEWTDVPYNASDFAGSGTMTWTVESGDVSTFKYKADDRTMIVLFEILTTAVGGTPTGELQITIPGGRTASAMTQASIYLLDNNVQTDGFARTAAGGTTIAIRRNDQAAFTASAGTTYVRGQMVIPVNP